jgi:hypothetical protein
MPDFRQKLQSALRCSTEELHEEVPPPGLSPIDELGRTPQEVDNDPERTLDGHKRMQIQ